MERTNGSFSCYQSCDSRWYEYLIPTFSFIPPHPQSYLGKKLVESAKLEDVLDVYQDRQKDAASFWETAEDVYVKPILDKLDLELRASVMAAIHAMEAEIEPKKEKSGALKEDSTDTLVLDAVEENPVIKSESAVDPKSEMTAAAADESENMSPGKRKAEEGKCHHTYSVCCISADKIPRNRRVAEQQTPPGGRSC
jgi:tRNA pseudouridine38-40 synthase